MLRVPSYPLGNQSRKTFLRLPACEGLCPGEGAGVFRLSPSPLRCGKKPRSKKIGERGAYFFWPTLSLLGLFYVALFFYSGPMARKILFLPEEILQDSRELGSVSEAGGVSLSSASSGVDLCLLAGGLD